MILKYQKVLQIHDDKQSTTITLVEPDYQNSDVRTTELCTIGEDTYVHIPNDMDLPIQPEQITVIEITLTDELKSAIKSNSPHVKLSYTRLQERIRSKYSIEDEQYFSRISIGSLSGTYAMQEDEPALIAEYQSWVEECREVARLERAAWDLS